MPKKAYKQVDEIPALAVHYGNYTYSMQIRAQMAKMPVLYSLQNQMPNVRIVADRRMVGSLRLNGQAITPESYTDVGSYGEGSDRQDFSFVDVALAQDFNVVSPRILSFGFTLLVYSDAAAYVPMFGDSEEGMGRMGRRAVFSK